MGFPTRGDLGYGSRFWKSGYTTFRRWGVYCRGASGGGLGETSSQLGIPGLIMVLWTSGALALYLRRILLIVQRSDPRLTRSTFGIVAFLAANIPMFMVASQVFGDPFVLFVLGWFVGFVLSVPRLISVERVDSGKIRRNIDLDQYSHPFV